MASRQPKRSNTSRTDRYKMALLCDASLPPFNSSPLALLIASAATCEEIYKGSYSKIMRKLLAAVLPFTKFAFHPDELAASPQSPVSWDFNGDYEPGSILISPDSQLLIVIP